MSAAEQKHYVLVADGDADFHEALAKEAAPELPKLISVRTLRDCQRRLSSRGTNFAGVFVNPALGSPAWIAVVRDVQNYHPNTPVFVVYDYSAPEEGVLADLGIKGVIKKPVTYVQLLKELQLVPLPSAPAKAEPAAGAKAGAAGSPDADYVPLRSIRLVSALPLQFDVYIRLSDGHYTKVWAAGSSVSHEQLKRHSGEGVEEYHILRKDQDACLRACKGHLERLIGDPAVPLEIKRAELASVGEDTIGMLKAEGIDGGTINHALDFVESSQKLAVEMLRNLGALPHFFADAAAMEHSVATALLGALMLSNIQMGPGASFNQIGAALMLHDCWLWGKEAVIQREDASKMSDSAKTTFHAHPAQSAQILKATGKFPPALIEAVEQHHMRLEGGFPKRQGVGRINRIAELIGISEEFAHHIEVRKGAAGAAREMLEKATGRFSAPILNAFQKTFLGP